MFPGFQNTNILMICPEIDISRVVTLAFGTIFVRLDQAELAENQNLVVFAFGMVGVFFRRLAAHGKNHTAGSECIGQSGFSCGHQLCSRMWLCVRGSDTIVGSTLQMCVRINVRSINAVFHCIFMYSHRWYSTSIYEYLPVSCSELCQQQISNRRGWFICVLVFLAYSVHPPDMRESCKFASVYLHSTSM
jgi:hypothetical protein